MKCSDMITWLERLAPSIYAESWDNTGLLVGDTEKEVNKVLVAVDATDSVIEEACQLRADMLITHHPLIFSGLKSVNEENFIGRRVRRLIREDISYYAMHTNFDIAGDMPGLVAARLPFGKTRILEATADGFGVGRIGFLTQPMSIRELTGLLKERMKLTDVMLYGDPEQLVEQVAVLPGSGKAYINAAVSQGAQLMITGDIDHHEGIDALAKGISILDAGHYGLEKIFVEYMVQSLREEWGNRIFVTAERVKQPFVIL